MRGGVDRRQMRCFGRPPLCSNMADTIRINWKSLSNKITTRSDVATFGDACMQEKVVAYGRRPLRLHCLRYVLHAHPPTSVSAHDGGARTFVRSCVFQGPLGQTHTHKPRKGVCGPWDRRSHRTHTDTGGTDITKNSQKNESTFPFQHKVPATFKGLIQ